MESTHYASFTTYLLKDVTFWRSRIAYWAERERYWRTVWQDPAQTYACRKARMHALRCLRGTYQELRSDVARATSMPYL